ncbi:MAG: hypothetical protein E7347_04515 [Clostridiales bacterium]|nr:hypothetical protein [Clostridiales bacterium]
MAGELFYLTAEELKFLDELSFLDDKVNSLSSSDTEPAFIDVLDLSFDISSLRCKLCRALVAHYKKFNKN